MKPIEVRDPRCVDGDCLFPACNCEYPPHDEEPSWWDNPLNVFAVLLPTSILIGATIAFAGFYVINELL